MLISSAHSQVLPLGPINNAHAHDHVLSCWRGYGYGYDPAMLCYTALHCSILYLIYCTTSIPLPCAVPRDAGIA